MTRSLKAVLHAHSTWSYDGHFTLPTIARTYGRLGVDVVMMTEHDTGFEPARFADYRAECAAASTGRCTLIPGIEYSSPDNDIHILTWGLDHFLAEHQPVIETLQKVQAAGGVAVFAHPIRRDAYKAFDPVWVPYLSGIELWNRKSDGISWGPEAATLIRQTALPGTVGHDFHRKRQIYPLSMRFDGLQPGNDLEAGLVAALKEGRGQPQAFGRPLNPASPAPGSRLHPRLEGLRRGLRDLLRGQNSRRPHR